MPPTVQASVGTTVDCYWRADVTLASAAMRREGRTPIFEKKRVTARAGEGCMRREAAANSMLPSSEE